MAAVFIQVQDGKVASGSLAALSAARIYAQQSGEKLHGILVGEGVSSAVASLNGFGLGKLIVGDSQVFARYLAPLFAEAVVSALTQLSERVVFIASTSTGKDFAPRVAAALSAGQASDIIGIGATTGQFVRPMFAGDVIAEVKVATDAKVITVRASAFEVAQAIDAAAPEVVALSSVPAAPVEVVEKYEISGSERPELGDATVVVSGGRALGSKEEFERVVFPLADTLGAAIGASRAAVDSGYAPNDWQVGQTGKIVAPTLYIAVGISGAIQHLAGMKDSKTIVAINKDSDAPIFEIADYGLVADLFTAVPEMTTKLR
jgi:electron transfer flavoprotein alpha subunit